jgi:hypothetical protein
MTPRNMAGWTNRLPAAAVEAEGSGPVVWEGESPPLLADGVMTAELEMMKELAVGPAVLVELDMGNDADSQVVVVEVVVEVWPGQLVAVGLHSVMVTVLVRVWVDVVVVSPSSAATMAKLAARTAMMLLNCIVTDWLDRNRLT